MYLTAAALLFALFSLNVVLGSFGVAPFLGDVSEMLVLLAASIAFVAAILGREADEKKNQGKQKI
jgi:hypothetical protein